VRRRGADRTLMVAGVVTIALGTLFLLDQLDVIDIRFGYTMPVLLAAIGAVLLTAGLDQGRR
jgi:preprotein translocase subunit SecE